MKKINKLALGTVQFGINYGISNKNGQVSIEEVGRILDYAKENGINTLDTASLYGTSEEVLGQFNLEDFNVVTKTIKINNTLDRQENFEMFKEAFYSSQRKLGYIELYGLLFHSQDDLLSKNGNELWDLVSDFKEKQYVQKIGVSVYEPEILLEIIDKFDIDIVQLPLNILDQRFVGVLDELKAKNIEVHTRSTFLQGLLLMENNEINPYFEEIKPLLAKIPSPKIAYALDFAKNLEQIDKIVLGCTLQKELQEIIMMYNKNIEKIDYSGFKVTNQNYINPSLWRFK